MRKSQGGHNKKNRSKMPVSKTVLISRKKPIRKQTADSLKALKERSKKRKIKAVALGFLTSGMLLIIISLVLEARQYPWGRLFGTASQNAETIPDPSPIKLDKEDKNVVIVSTAPVPPSTTPGTTASAAPPAPGHATSAPSVSASPSA